MKLMNKRIISLLLALAIVFGLTSMTTFATEETHTHTYEATVTAPTCTERGYTTYTCECGDCYTDDYTESTGHSFTEWYETKKATFDESGEEARDCTKCSHYETREVPLTVITTGNFGAGTKPTDAVTYTLYSNGTMVMEGTGKLFNTYWRGDDQPYHDYRHLVKELIISEGITSTNGGNFAYFTNLERVSFPSTLTRIPNNAFMCAFADSVISITIPQTVTYLGAYSFGNYGAGTWFTDIIIENPNMTFADSTAVFNGGKQPKILTLYSYGTNNNVSAYAEKIGCRYVNLNDYVTGEIDGIRYELANGILTLFADTPDSSIPTSDQPWAEFIDGITSIVISSGITSIPANAFTDYPALAEVELPDDLESIGDGAFAVTGQNSTELTMKLPYHLQSLGKNIFQGRSNVRITAYYGAVGSALDESGVELTLKKRFKLLAIGNSYSEDATCCAQGMQDSQLFNILQAMLGEDAEITLGAIISGGKGINWHATQAEQGNSSYYFKVMTSDSKTWKSLGSVSSANALSWTDWDAVTLQHYGINTATGQESISYPETTDEKFYLLETASEYMLDHIDKYAPFAKVYFYMHWYQTTSLQLNAGLSRYNTMAAFFPVVLDYAGTESGKQFETIIPVGLSVQNARSTYLSLLSYNPTAYADKNLNLYTDAQIGLQRDGGHLSFNIGRYIAGLTFAEIIIPEEIQAEGYVLPDIRITESVGQLPKDYTIIAQKAVHAAVESWKNGSLAVTTIEGYEEDPTVAASKNLTQATLDTIHAADPEILKTRITRAILTILPEDFAVDAVTLPEDLSISGALQECNVQVVIRFGYTSVTVPLTVNIQGYTAGDINGDGVVDNKDLTRLFRYLSGYEIEVNEAALDINGDGELDNKDLTRLFQYLSSWEVEIY